MSSSYFLKFAKSGLAFRAIYKLSLKINEGAAYVGSTLKLRFQSGVFNIMLRQLRPVPPGLDLGRNACDQIDTRLEEGADAHTSQRRSLRPICYCLK